VEKRIPVFSLDELLSGDEFKQKVSNCDYDGVEEVENTE
jgi:hypothetical protein